MSVEIANESGTDVPLEHIHDLIRFAFAELRVHDEADVAVIAVDEEAMAELHKQWMDQSGPTDVLSFPMDELRMPGPADEPVAGILGDIVICPSYVEKQVTESGKDLEQELQLLTVHGLLHLLGFDHATPDEEKEMFSLQDGLLQRFRESLSGGVR